MNEKCIFQFFEGPSGQVIIWSNRTCNDLTLDPKQCGLKLHRSVYMPTTTKENAKEKPDEIQSQRNPSQKPISHCPM